MFKNASGISLVEVIIAGTVMIGIGLGVSKMTTNVNKNIKLSEKNLEVVSLLGEMRGVLSAPTACKNSFDTLNGKLSSLLDIRTFQGASAGIKNSNNEYVFEVDKNYGSSGVKLSSIEINDSQDDVAITTNGQGSTNLLITFDRGEKSSGVRFISKKIRLNVNAIGDNISSCNAFASGESSIWTRNTADPNTIYYNYGSIGVGTTTPGSKLEVYDGNIIANDSDSNFVQLWSDNAVIAGRNGSMDSLRFGFADDASATGWSEKVRIEDNSGNVGIGVTNPQAKLDIAGGIKLGSPTVCNASLEGLIKYDPGVPGLTKKGLSFCDGVSFRRTSHFFPSVSHATLKTFHPDVIIGNCVSWNTLISACNRYCRARGYSFGTSTECNAAGEKSACGCTY